MIIKNMKYGQVNITHNNIGYFRYMVYDRICYISSVLSPGDVQVTLSDSEIEKLYQLELRKLKLKRLI